MRKYFFDTLKRCPTFAGEQRFVHSQRKQQAELVSIV